MKRDLLGELRRTNGVIQGLEETMDAELVEVHLTVPQRVDYDLHRRAQDRQEVFLILRSEFSVGKCNLISN